MNKATVISSIKAIAGKTLPAGSTLLLYGSRARCDNRPDSDWDLLILLDKPSLSFRDYDYGYPFSELGCETSEEINAQVYSKQEKSVRVSGKTGAQASLDVRQRQAV